MSTIGLIGSGNMGGVLARAAIDAGYEVLISNSRGPESLKEMVDALGPHARAGSVDQVATQSDLVVLVAPFHSLPQLPGQELAGKVVIDAMNYWAPRDGRVPVIDNHETTSSEMVADRAPGASIIKGFNAIMAEHITEHARPGRDPGRRAIPIAGDDAEAKRIVASFIDDLGFDALDIGSLSAGRVITPADAWERPLNRTETSELMTSRLSTSAG